MASKPLSVLLFNINCGSLSSRSSKEDKENAKTIPNDQCTGIRQVIGSTSGEPNLFVFAQDGLEEEKLNTLQRSLSWTGPSPYDVQSEPEEPTPLSCENKYAEILQDRRQESSVDSKNFVRKEDFEPFIFLERLTAYTIILNDQRILLVSWHGPKTGFTDLMKSLLFRSLILSVAEVQEKTKADIVVLGGDFNMELWKAQDADRKYKLLDTPTRNGRFVPDTRDTTDFSNSVDFIVVWPKDRVEVDLPRVLKFEFDIFAALNTYRNSKIVSFEGERKCTVLQPFNHPRVLYNFRIKPKAVSGALESPHSTDDVDSLAENMTDLQAT